jgi:hypothetical protein
VYETAQPPAQANDGPGSMVVPMVKLIVSTVIEVNKTFKAAKKRPRYAQTVRPPFGGFTHCSTICQNSLQLLQLGAPNPFVLNGDLCSGFSRETGFLGGKPVYLI